jgi:tetratricopeptide (TPR) repeat protein
MKKRIMFLLLLLITHYSLLITFSNADTIYTSEGKELKGIVVEDYKDRLKFSTPDGEITVMKADIKELYYDTEEDNLIKLAEQMFERKDYVRAYAFYDKALRANPDSRRAKDGVVFLQGFLFRKDQAMKEEVVRRQEELERGQGAVIPVEKTEDEYVKERAEALRKNIGIVLVMKGSFPVVAYVDIGSVAYEAGIKPGDMIIAVWGKLTGYLSLKEAIEMLLEKPSLELKIIIERTIELELKPNRNMLTSTKEMMSASLAMQFDGLTVTDVASPDTGLKAQDIITAIDGKSTRYMPLKNAIELIRGSKKDTVPLTIRRELLIWRKDWS